MIRRLTLIVGLTALTLSAQAQRPDRQERTPSQRAVFLIKRLVANTDKQRYSGTRTVEFKIGSKYDKHTEIVFRFAKLSRVEFPTGSRLAGQIIIEDGIDRKQFFPERNEVVVLPPRREAAMEHLSSFIKDEEKWKFSTNRGDPIAGQRTVQVDVSDLKGNVVQRLWIEPRVGILLKRQLFDPVGAPVASFEFTEIDLNPTIPPGIFTFDRKGVKFVTPNDLMEREAKKAGFEVYAFGPASGLRMESSRVATHEGKSILIQHYLSKSGRITLFEFIGRVAVDGDQVKRMARGDFSSYEWNVGKSTFVVVGSMDKAALQRLASQLVPGTGTGRD